MLLTIAVATAEVWMISFAVLLSTRATRHYCVAAASSAVISGYLSMAVASRWPLPIAAALGVAAGTAAGAVYYSLSRRLLNAGARDAYLLLVSLATFGVVGAIAELSASGRGAMIPLTETSETFGVSTSRLIVLGIRILIALLAGLLWYRGGFGLRLRAMGEDRDALSLRGVDVDRLEILAALVGFGFASVEGVLLVIDGQLTVERAFTGSLWAVAIILAMQFTRESLLTLTVGAVVIAAVLSGAPYLLEGDWSVAISISIVAILSLVAGQRILHVE